MFIFEKHWPMQYAHKHRARSNHTLCVNCSVFSTFLSMLHRLCLTYVRGISHIYATPYNFHYMEMGKFNHKPGQYKRERKYTQPKLRDHFPIASAAAVTAAAASAATHNVIHSIQEWMKRPLHSTLSNLFIFVSYHTVCNTKHTEIIFVCILLASPQYIYAYRSISFWLI